MVTKGYDAPCVYWSCKVILQAVMGQPADIPDLGVGCIVALIQELEGDQCHLLVWMAMHRLATFNAPKDAR